MQKILLSFTIFGLLIGCNPDSSKGNNQNTNKDQTPGPEKAFNSIHQKVMKSSSVFGERIGGWEEYFTLVETEDSDSAYYYVAYEEIQGNQKQPLAIYQQISFVDGDWKTKQMIDTYIKRTVEGEKFIHVSDPAGNTVIFRITDEGLVSERTYAKLQKLENHDFLPLFRRTSGIILPGVTFQRCKDDILLAFYEDHHLTILKNFHEQLVGEKKRASAILEGLFTKPDYGERELFRITEIKMVNERSNCQ
ncbi:MAG: hypothetical protein JJU02_09870 [Cryomorphaceae bacterium]|nr:hypothetical protein [Cryomorphaceae bacterium]